MLYCHNVAYRSYLHELPTARRHLMTFDRQHGPFDSHRVNLRIWVVSDMFVSEVTHTEA